VAIPLDLLARVQPHTKSTPVRLGSMYEALLAIDAEEIPGDVVECGVWRGGNIMLARLVSPARECWLYDTFNGMPEPDHEFDRKRPHDDGRLGELAIDRYRAKEKGGTRWDKVSLVDVQQQFLEMNLLDDRIHWIEGEVESTLLDRPLPDIIAILRLDLDWYWPTKVSLEQLYPRLADRAFLIIDDYGHWMGCKKAVDDFFADGRPEMRQIDYSCVVMRKC
jgi:O-methyltransferase